jgi:cell division protein FtsA
MAKQRFLTSLDIGSDQVSLYIAELMSGGELQIRAHVSVRSRGIENGQVVDLSAAAQAVREALERAEEETGCEVFTVRTNVAASSVEGQNSCGMIILSQQERMITQRDVERAIKAASESSVPLHEQVVYSHVQSFVVNQQEGIKNPRGMMGSRLGAYCHVVTAPSLQIDNIKRCVRMAGLEVEDCFPDALATSHAVLTEDEKELGVVVIDVGRGSSDLALVLRGSLQYTSRSKWGVQQVLDDISAEFKTTFEGANNALFRSGCMAETMSTSRQEALFLPGISGRPGGYVPAQKVAEVGRRSIELALKRIRSRLAESGMLEKTVAGAVLCGGLFLIEGSAPLAEEVLGLSVRVGESQGIQTKDHGLLAPNHTVGIGLLLQGLGEKGSAVPSTAGGALNRMITRTQEWIHEIF